MSYSKDRYRERIDDDYERRRNKNQSSDKHHSRDHRDRRDKRDRSSSPRREREENDRNRNRTDERGLEEQREKERKRQRLEKLKKLQLGRNSQQDALPDNGTSRPGQAQGRGGVNISGAEAAEAAPRDEQVSQQEAKAAWVPWDDINPNASHSPIPGPMKGSTGKLSVEQQAQQQQQQQQSAPPQAASRIHPPTYGAHMPPPEILKKNLAAIDRERELRKIATGEGLAQDEADPLDAFMESAVMPEVAEKQKQEALQKMEEKVKLAKLAAEGKAPKLPKVLDDSDEDDTGDVEIDVPSNKVKMIVGAGGSKIQEIEKKSKCRIQIKKSQEELSRAFGSGPSIPLLKGALPDQLQKSVRVAIFGEPKGLEIAQRMIQEAIDNKEQKTKNRQKEYERKREEKRRNVQIYQLRHTRDYEELEVRIGASKDEVKKAYRKMAVKWHPDKHPDNQEAAKQKFQRIQAAYNSLMTTDAGDTVEQLRGS